MVLLLVLSRTSTACFTPNPKSLNSLQPLASLFPDPVLYFQQVTASFAKTPGVGVPPPSRSFGISNIQTLFSGPVYDLVNAPGPLGPHCPLFLATRHSPLSVPLCFHILTNCFSRKFLVLTTIQSARGGWGKTRVKVRTGLMADRLDRGDS